MTASVAGRLHPRPAIVLGLFIVLVAFLAGLEVGSSTALIISTSGAADLASPATRSDWATSFLLAEAQPSTRQMDDVQQTIAAHAAIRGGLFERLKRVEDDFVDRLVGDRPVSPASLEPYIEQIVRLRRELLLDATDEALRVRAQLTPEQIGRARARRDRARAYADSARRRVAEGWGDDTP